MDFMSGSGYSSDEQQDSAISSWQPHHHDLLNNNKDKKICNRHNSFQIQLLEAFFKECPHPNDDQKRQLSRELGLGLKQIKFWFQNKRTQTKAQIDRADNNALRAENERISCENYALKETLNHVICPGCGGPPFGQDERKCNLERLRLENAQLKLEHERLSKVLANYTGEQAFLHIQSVMDQVSNTTTLPSSGAAPSMNNNQQHGILGSCSSAAEVAVAAAVENNKNKVVMMEMAAKALEELYKLLRINEPLWMQAKGDIDGRYKLDRNSYQKLCQLLRLPTATHGYCPTHHYEASKHTALVPMNSLELVDAFLDSGKWSELFPTIVTQARTLQVLEAGIPNNRSGSVQLMNAEMHVLSPLVPSRQYYFLRCCQQIEAGLWVIADVSYSRRSDNSSHCSWRLPSGCMIQDLSSGCSKVTWVEHIVEEEDDRSRSRQYGGLYGGILSSGLAYGAERWVASLERQTQRLISMNYLSSNRINRGQQPVEPPPLDQALAAASGRNSSLIMKLAGRMVKGFCTALLNLTTATADASNMRVSVRQGIGKETGDPIGTIISASTSLWLPIPQQQLIDFLGQVKTRMQWDVLANGNPMYEVVSISSADGLLHPGNSISIMQPMMPVESTILLQEICTDSNTGSSLLVYAPIDITAFTSLLSNSWENNDSNTLETLSLLPLGFTICASDPPHTSSSHENEDGYRGNDTTTKISGSLLTAAFQMLVSGPSTSSHDLQLQTTMDCIATIHVLLNSTIHKIKSAFNCSASS